MSQEEEKKKPNMVPLIALNKASKSICKIILGEDKKFGTGFLMNIKIKGQNLFNCLLTNFHILDNHTIDTNTHIELEIEEKKIPLKKNSNRIIKLFNKPIDITLIEIIEEDELPEDIIYLSYDLNYIKNGYDCYLNKEIFVLQHPYGEDMHSALGKITKIKDFEFEHEAGTCPGSSGSPIILIENNQVIGIHKGKNKNDENKRGTFIGKLLDSIEIDSKLEKKIENLGFELNFETRKIEYATPKNINTPQSLPQEIDDADDNNQLNNPQKNYENILYLKYNIQKNKNIVTLFNNQFLKGNKYKFRMIINREIFDPCNQFDISKIKVTNNILEVKLKQISDVKNLESMFEETDLNFISGFSSFDSNKLKKISKLFFGCKYLTTIKDIDDLNISNVEKMDRLFQNCKSLETLPDISKWDTKKVTHMNYVFSGCEKLNSLPDLSKWNVCNVKEMNHMFSKCKSLLLLPDYFRMEN